MCFNRHRLCSGGADVRIDIEELLATPCSSRASGSGKSHCCAGARESAALVQQVMIDPEGDFVTLAEPFGHIVVDGPLMGGRRSAASPHASASIARQSCSRSMASKWTRRCVRAFLGALSMRLATNGTSPCRRR